MLILLLLIDVLVDVDVAAVVGGVGVVGVVVVVAVVAAIADDIVCALRHVCS